MSLAPRPGIGERKAATKRAQVTISITVRGGVPFVVAPLNVPIMVKDRFERETGRSVEYATATRATMGEVQIAMLCYLAVLLTGEGLRYSSFLEEWPEGIDEDEIEVTVSEEGGNDPEASGPA